MTKLRCTCGEILSDVSSPCRSNGWLIRDIDLEKSDLCIIQDGVDVWECSKCGRIAIGNRIDSSVKWFFPESGKPENINS